MLRGAIICESLRPGTTLEGHDLRVVKWSRYDVTGAAHYQPTTWTLVEFEAPDEADSRLADDLAASLLLPGWYANWHSDNDDTATVVFPGKVFRYRRGDATARAEAQQHGRTCGVPEPQLDWGD